MSEERRCPIFWETKMHRVPPCNGKILRREPAFSSEKMAGQIYGLKNIGGRAAEEKVPYYIYECEHGHLLSRPDGWADVPIVPPGTIKSIYGGVNRPPKWYQDSQDVQDDDKREVIKVIR